MKKGKNILTSVLVMTMLSSMGVYAEDADPVMTEEAVSAEETSVGTYAEPTVEWVIPNQIKIGETIETIAIGRNLQPDCEVTVTEPMFEDAYFFGENGYKAHAFGPAMSDKNGVGEVTTGHTANGISAFAPCTVTLRYGLYERTYDEVEGRGYQLIQYVGEPYTVTVVKPVIEDNAPQRVQNGGSIYLNTELTNTALTNTDVAYYYNPDNYDVCLIEDETHKAHEAAYQPKVEVIEGTDLVTQSEQDYSHTLTSSEKLTFSGEGTVKLRIVYEQIKNCPWMEEEFYGAKFYSPEKIITIQVGAAKDSGDFEDVDLNAWYGEYITYVSENGYMTGLNETTFGVNEKLARAQFAVMLHRIDGEEFVKYDGVFPDVRDGEWYTDAIAWANQQGIVTGYTDSGLFGLGDNITREQMATMMYRYANYKNLDVSKRGDASQFPDAEYISDFASDAMLWAIGEGIITGDNGLANPQGIVNRAVAATMLTRFEQNILSK